MWIRGVDKILRGLVETWQIIYSGLTRDGELGRLAVVSMLMFQLAVGTAGLKLIAEHRADAGPSASCAGAHCASPAGSASVAGGSVTATRPVGARASLDELLTTADPDPAPRPTADGDEPASAEDGGQQPPAEPEPTPEASAENASGASLTAQSLLEEAPLPPAEEVFELPADPTPQNLPTRRMSYDEFAEHGPEMIERLPSLEVLHEYFPENPMTSDVEAQKQHIVDLHEQVEVSVEDYERLAVDRTRRRAFRSVPNYHDEIEPRMFVVHWTGMGYRGVDHFVKSMKPNRVQYFINRDARVFELFESDVNWPGHALGANDFAQGVEIETGHFDERTSPLFSYSPAQIEHTIYVAVEFLRRNGLPVDETTLVGHYAVDLLFTNPYYDPHTGRFTQDRVRKFDPPQELMEVVVHKAQQLDAALGER